MPRVTAAHRLVAAVGGVLALLLMIAGEASATTTTQPVAVWASRASPKICGTPLDHRGCGEAGTARGPLRTALPAPRGYQPAREAQS